MARVVRATRGAKQRRYAITVRERRLLGFLGALVVLAGVAFAARRLMGRTVGAPCTDSYNCRGIGSECLEADGLRYCTIYCDADRECPDGWRCVEGYSTLLMVETQMKGRVCTR